MSEYQYVAFRAVDRSVSQKNLAYMRRQSTRAHITPWTFENEYHFGDFHGNALEMMRRGYDIHLHYANFGTRTLWIRLPGGLPDPRAAKPYIEGESIRFRKDKKGPGGTLAIEPYFEGGDLDDCWDLDEMLDRLVPLRAEILAGDLRPLYLAHLAVSRDGNHDPEDSVEGAVPAGLGKPTDAQLALADFYALGNHILAAAAQASGPLPTARSREPRLAAWVAQQPEATKNGWLVELLGEEDESARAKILTRFEKSSGKRLWPTVDAGRTVAQLETAAETIHCRRKKATAAQAARKRAELLKKMAKDPAPYLRKTEKLVAERSTDAYNQAAKLLADLREALAGGKRAEVAAKQALELKTANPTLRNLTAALRRQGFLPK